MEIKHNIGDTVYHAAPSGVVVAYRLAKIMVQEVENNDGGVGIAYFADKKGNETAMHHREVFSTEEEARDFLLEEAKTRYEAELESIHSAPVNREYVAHEPTGVDPLNERKIPI